MAENKGIGELGSLFTDLICCLAKQVELLYVANLSLIVQFLNRVGLLVIYFQLVDPLSFEISFATQVDVLN